MKINTSELEGAALDWAVAAAIGRDTYHSGWAPSTYWAQGGPLIERYRVSLTGPGPMGGPLKTLWSSMIDTGSFSGSRGYSGSTPLIAAMRAIVAAEMGDTVDVPEESL